MLVPFAEGDRQSQSFLSLLAIANGDITSKRNGIWVLKPHDWLTSLSEMWRQIFSKTRTGSYTLPRGDKRAEKESSIAVTTDSWVASSCWR